MPFDTFCDLRHVMSKPNVKSFIAVSILTQLRTLLAFLYEDVFETISASCWGVEPSPFKCNINSESWNVQLFSDLLTYILGLDNLMNMILYSLHLYPITFFNPGGIYVSLFMQQGVRDGICLFRKNGCQKRKII